MTTPMAQAAHVSQPGRRLRVLGALAGITGPVLLVAYFTAPALVGWPSAGASPGKLITYATAHRLLFYSGGWLQVTGVLLSIVFFLVLLQLSGARATLAGSAADRRAAQIGGHARFQPRRTARAACEARAWPTRQPHSGRVKLGQNFQKSIPSFQVANVASVLAVEAGLSLTAGLLEGRREDRVMGEARLHVVFGTGQAGSSLRNWPGWVSRSRRCPGTGQSCWLGGRTGGPAAGAADREVAAGAAKGASVVYQCVNAPYAQWPERFPLLQRACWLLPSAPARCRWWWRTYAATAGPGAEPARPGRRRRVMGLIDEALSANATIANGYDPSRGGPPAPKIAIVTCADPRLTSIEQMLGLAAADVDMIRNFGTVIDDDAVRSLVLSTRLLGTREIMIINHTDCGMLRFTDREFEERLRKETGQAPIAPARFYSFTDAEANTKEQIQKARSHPWISPDVPVRGFVYDVSTGRLSEVFPDGETVAG